MATAASGLASSVGPVPADSEGESCIPWIDRPSLDLPPLLFFTATVPTTLPPSTHSHTALPPDDQPWTPDFPSPEPDLISLLHEPLSQSHAANSQQDPPHPLIQTSPLDPFQRIASPPCTPTKVAAPEAGLFTAALASEVVRQAYAPTAAAVAEALTGSSDAVNHDMFPQLPSGLSMSEPQSLLHPSVMGLRSPSLLRQAPLTSGSNSPRHQQLYSRQSPGTPTGTSPRRQHSSGLFDPESIVVRSDSFSLLQPPSSEPGSVQPALMKGEVVAGFLSSLSRKKNRLKDFLSGQQQQTAAAALLDAADGGVSGGGSSAAASNSGAAYCLP